MYVIQPKGRKKKYDLRFRNWNGQVVRVPGDRDKTITKIIGDRIDLLIKARLAGDPPPAALATWIANLSPTFEFRLVSLGLIFTRHVERNKPIDEQIKVWGDVVRERKSKEGRHADQQVAKVEKIFQSLNAQSLADFVADEVRSAINAFKIPNRNGKSLAASTRRSYGIAAKDFTAWLAKRLKLVDPLADLELPSDSENVEYERQPLTVEQFRTLVTYLGTFERYKNQKSRWTASERKLVYLTAVSTGYRQNEMRKLRVFNLHLDEKPPVICLKARDAKNARKGEIPIAQDLAIEMRRHVASLEADDPVFRMPSTSGSIVDMLRLDLSGAGIKWKLPGGEVHDFHSLRSTAISWWLDVYGLSPKRVQMLARLSGLGLVQNYSRNLRLEDFSWLRKGPNLLGHCSRRKAG